MALPMFERALLLLEVSCDHSRESLSALSMAVRDLKLLQLRDALFGSTIPCMIHCPACNEGLELDLDGNDLRVSLAIESETPYKIVELNDLTLKFRLPNSNDLAAIYALSDPTRAQSALLQQCMVAAIDGGRELDFAELQPEVVSALSNAIAQSDKQSRLELELTCPACMHQWSVMFDVVSYLWSEIHNWAIRTLREVNLLASSFGWSETEILALSPMRRKLYLESLGA